MWRSSEKLTLAPQVVSVFCVIHGSGWNIGRRDQHYESQMKAKPLITTCNILITAIQHIYQKENKSTTAAQHFPYSQKQTKRLTAICNKLISLRLDIPEHGREEQQKSSRDTPDSKHNTSHTNTTCPAYRISDHTAHNNLQQIDINEL